MSQTEKAKTEQFWSCFQPQFLSNVPRGTTKIDLVDGDIEALLQHGLIEETDEGDLEFATALHLFSVAEEHKNRRRLIIHTIGVNGCAEAPHILLPTPCDNISNHSTFNACLDASVFYNQFPLPF